MRLVKKMILLVLFIFVFVIRCGTVEPEGSKASMVINLTKPDNGSTLSDNTPTFDWSDVSEAANYEIQVDNTNSFASPDIDESNLTSSTYTALNSLTNGKYYWRVRAKDSEWNWGEWSSVWSFTINAQGPSSPTLSLPPDSSTTGDNTPEFDWSDVSEATNYEIQVDNTNSFASPDIDESNLTSPTYTAANSLTDGTYYWRVRAKNSQDNWGDWSSVWSFTIDTQYETGTMTDQDGNTYKTVKIGNQWWMAENLKVTHYCNGDAIPNVTDNSEWEGLYTGAYCAYDNNESNADTYGYLYNWYAVDDSRNIAPEGWHVPTDEEWKELEMYLGMSQTEVDKEGWRGTNEGSKLAGNASLWYDGVLKNNSSFGQSGFTALPGGKRYPLNGYFYDIGEYAYFWFCTESGAGQRVLGCDNSFVSRSFRRWHGGFSLRLIRD